MKRRSFAEFALGGLAATGIGRGEIRSLQPKLNTVLYKLMRYLFHQAPPSLWRTVWFPR